MRFLLLGLALLVAAPAAAKSKSKAAPLGPVDVRAVHDQLTPQIAATYDTSRGGFVTKRGEPMESTIELAFQIARERPNDVWRSEALETVDWMMSLIDSVGGGFLGAGSDAAVARIEKQTVPNARRLENLIDAYEVSNDHKYRLVAGQTVDFFERVLIDARGGFVTDQVGDRDLQPAANGIAIHAYVRWSEVTSDRRFLNFALKSIDRVWKNCWDEQMGVLLRRGTFGELLQYPQLDDQTEMGRAVVRAYQIGKRPIDLEHAKALGDLLLSHFEDSRGGFKSQAVPMKNGSIKNASRASEENAVASRFLYELATVTGDAKYAEGALRAWGPFRDDFAKAGNDAAEWALAARAAFAPSTPATPDWQVVESIPTTTQPRVMRFKRGRR